ncbi:MAG: tetratricopeptide repeat protein [Emcibacter sp.]|nr:tetratricopeptide repeat protein [Emcibacter sp.]MBL4894918.1 tetratricopeptide repeat protein [Emcibacter sp.]
MNRIYIIKTLVLAVIAASTSLVMGATAQQLDVSNQKELYWSIGTSDLVVKAGQRLEAGKLDQARRLYRQSLRTTLRQNDRLTAYINLSVIHNTQKAYGKALKYSDKALKIAPDNWLALNNKGTAYFGLGKYDRAQENYAQALSLKPDDEGLAHNAQLTQLEITPVYANK